MPEENKSDATPGFDDLVSMEQSANNFINEGASKGEQPTETPTEEPKDDEPEEKPEENKEEETPDQNKDQNKDLIFGKFKSLDDAKGSYDQAQTKIIEQGTKINELTKAREADEQIISTINKALEKNPELAEQIKAALADEPEEQGEKPVDFDTLIENKLTERETQKQIKTEREDWVKNHPDVEENNGELGHKIIDYIEKEGYPLTSKSMQLVYDHFTKEKAIEDARKKATEDAVKKEEIAELDRKNGAGVGGGNSDTKTDTPQGSTFDTFVGGTLNPNKIR